MTEVWCRQTDCPYWYKSIEDEKLGSYVCNEIEIANGGECQEYVAGNE